MEDIYVLDDRFVEYAISTHIKEYTVFMNEVLEMEMVFGLPRKECVDIVMKRFPNLIKN